MVFSTGLILDQGLPRSCVELLRRRGAQCEHVANLGMAAAEDHEVLAEANAAAGSLSRSMRTFTGFWLYQGR